jgi:hypothetical protein
MNTSLAAAAPSPPPAALVGLGHSVIGEIMIFRHPAWIALLVVSALIVVSNFT